MFDIALFEFMGFLSLNESGVNKICKVNKVAQIILCFYKQYKINCEITQYNQPIAIPKLTTPVATKSSQIFLNEDRPQFVNAPIRHNAFLTS